MNTDMQTNLPPIIDVQGVLLSADILTEYFCCDLDACGGACCIEGDAGAPLTLDEIGEIEDSLDTAWPHLSAKAQSIIDRQGVAYTDPEGELVTSIVDGIDCVFTYHDNGCCFCALERACREGRSQFMKPISCALYPIREKRFSDGSIGLNYHRWSVCHAAVKNGRELRLPLFKFLRDPLTRRFGAEWYSELEEVATALNLQS